MHFSVRTKIRFAHVDAAGIVFYPRYFEMLNAALEDWFADALGIDFSTLHLSRRLGAPTVRLSCEFYVPSLLGDEVEISVTPIEIGRSSCAIRYSLRGDGVERLKADAVIVCMELEAKRATPWPDDMRARMVAGLCPPENVPVVG
jgi:4-hydroxybenzoyl-CoA thioesterase